MLCVSGELTGHRQKSCWAVRCELLTYRELVAHPPRNGFIHRKQPDPISFWASQYLWCINKESKEFSAGQRDRVTIMRQLCIMEIPYNCSTKRWAERFIYKVQHCLQAGLNLRTSVADPKFQGQVRWPPSMIVIGNWSRQRSEQLCQNRLQFEHRFGNLPYIFVVVYWQAWLTDKKTFSA